MSQTVRCDIAIIGGGAGGLSLAASASQLGAKVIIIESGKMGGDCLNYGCVPSKSLLSAAKAVYHVRFIPKQPAAALKRAEILCFNCSNGRVKASILILVPCLYCKE